MLHLPLNADPWASPHLKMGTKRGPRGQAAAVHAQEMKLLGSCSLLILPQMGSLEIQ